MSIQIALCAVGLLGFVAGMLAGSLITAGLFIAKEGR